MGKNFFLPLTLPLIISCVSSPQKTEPSIFLCSAYCYYQSTNHGFVRDWIDVANPKLDLSWDDLSRRCSFLGVKQGRHDLQKSLGTPQSPGDNFTAATKENSCSGYVRVRSPGNAI